MGSPPSRTMTPLCTCLGEQKGREEKELSLAFDWIARPRSKARATETVCAYQTKNGNQQIMNVPIIIPNVRAALCSRFIFIKCLSFVGVWSWSTSFIVNIFDEPDPLSASPASRTKSALDGVRLRPLDKRKWALVRSDDTVNFGAEAMADGYDKGDILVSTRTICSASTRVTVH